MSQKQLATEIGVSPSRISDYISGRAEPTLKIARLLCVTLGITPAAMLGYQSKADMITTQNYFKHYDCPEQYAEAFQQMIETHERWREQIREQEAKSGR